MFPEDLEPIGKRELMENDYELTFNFLFFLSSDIFCFSVKRLYTCKYKFSERCSN